MSHFLFLHPNYKKLVDFISESVFINFIKYYRKNDLKKHLQEMNAAYYALNLNETNIESTESEVYFQLLTNYKYIKNFIKKKYSLKNKILNLSKDFSKTITEQCLQSGKMFMKPKAKILIENSLEKSESEQVIKVTSDIALFKSIEKLKQWSSLNLNEQIMHEELRNKRFKKKTDQNQSAANLTETKPAAFMEDDLSSEKPIFNQNYLMPSEIFSKYKVNCFEALLKRLILFDMNIKPSSF
jgi:hypothetical protein